jgi:hypothetical protein
MEIESRQKRQVMTNALLNTLPDLAIAVALAWFFNGGLLGFVVTFLGIQLLYFVLWIRNTAWAWIMFNWRGRKALAGLIQGLLTRSKFPRPGERYGATEDYFNQVMSDERVPADARMVAAIINSWQQYAIQSGRYQEAFRLNLSTEDALLAYKASLPSA